ncbi:all trans-polyprenyl-diphosphate synthase PDSS2-like [Linepithema humile]|uniref:all trans-polyprenyl-diphosphate synthase PDSS2-like n=1 Tax=Linepithema humile TaxID=83485 RepID=UPI00351DBC19
MSQAEKIVGYPTSFLSLNWMRAMKIANVALHLRKLVGSNHPLLKAANLIVLLMSKAVGHLNAKLIEEDKATGVLHSQRVLAEVIQIICASNLVHKSLENINTNESLESLKLKNFGNKMALSCGDYLLGNCCIKLATLRNQDVDFLIYSAIRDLYQAEFVARRDSQNFPIPSIPPKHSTGYALKEWTLLKVYSGGSLLGKSCQGTLKLAGHNEEIQEKGYKFGKHLALAWQASLDLDLCLSNNKEIIYNLCAAPIMFHVEHNPLILIELDKGLESVEKIDYLKLLDIVTAGPGIELTKELAKSVRWSAPRLAGIQKPSTTCGGPHRSK